MRDVRTWLDALGLGKYAEAFEANDVDQDVFSELDHEALKDLGVDSVGHRLRILKAIRSLESPSTQSDAAPPAELTAAPPTEAERRQLTVMFADLVGSTALSQRLDPEDLREINRLYQDAAKASVEDCGGYVARYMGDGVLAYFGFPRAHEDDAERAVRAGLAVIEAVRTLTSTVELAARVGIATGPVVVGDLIGEGASQESAVVGETPNLAARLQGLAAPNAVVISEQTRRLTAGAFVYDDLGEHAVKGLEGLVQVWAARGEAESVSRFEALHGDAAGLFVGREHDLGMLLERWQQAQSGEGRAVLVRAEPGIGKSRLANALRERLADTAHVWVRHQCSAHHRNTALYPFIAQLERAAGIEPGDDDAAKLDKLVTVLKRGHACADDESVALVASLLRVPSAGRFSPLRLTPQQQKARTFESLLGQLAGLAEERPVLWLFEDAHWADPTTRELLDFIVDRLQDVRVLAVVTARPEYEAGWAGMGHASILALGRLSRAQSSELIDDLIGGHALPDPVREQIVARTDGVPLFVEELTKAVLESELVTESADPQPVLGPLDSVRIPATLQDSLMARLDRLLGDAKKVAQTAAAIGREFQRELLSRVMSGDTAALERSLAELVDAGLIFRRGVPPADRFVFKHALVQDTALDSMLRRTRQTVHRRIAEVLEADFPATSDNEPEVLAHHLSEAGESDRAIDYWQRAAQRAAQGSAYVETVSHAAHALQLLGTLPRSSDRDARELALQAMLGPAQMAVHGFASGAVEQAYTRARELAERLDESDSLFQSLYGLFRLYLIRAQYESAGEMARALMTEAEHRSERTFRITAHRAMGNSALWLGEGADALPHLEQGIALYDRVADRDLALVYGDDPGVDCLAYASLGRWWLGQCGPALALRDQAVALAREIAHPFTLGRALAFSCIVDACGRSFAPLIDNARELLELSTEHRLANWKGVAQMLLDIGCIQQGRDAPEDALFERGWAQFRATGARVLTRFWPALLADVHARAGHVDAGRAALQLAKDADDTMAFWDAELARIEGDLAAQNEGTDAMVEASYQRALSISRRQGARALELRAATSLARFWCARGKAREAVALLSPIYEAITERLDTPDRRDARELLDALA